LNLIAADTHVKSVDFGASIVTPSSVLDFESPFVQRARHAALVEFPVGERCPHVGTAVVERVIMPTVMEYRDGSAIYFKRDSLPFRDRANFGDGDVVRNDTLRCSGRV
jgi:hypothetical protein